MREGEGRGREKGREEREIKIVEAKNNGIGCIYRT